MSRLSAAVRRAFQKIGVTPPPINASTAKEFMQKVLGDDYADIEALTQKLIVAMDNADTNDDKFLDKREIIRGVVSGAINSTGVTMPSWAINWFIEELLALVRIPDFKIPVPRLPKD